MCTALIEVNYNSLVEKDNITISDKIIVSCKSTICNSNRKTEEERGDGGKESELL